MNHHRRHRPLSLLAATVIDDDDNIRHDNINQHDEDVDDDECRITLTMTNDKGGGGLNRETRGVGGCIFLQAQDAMVLPYVAF